MVTFMSLIRSAVGAGEILFPDNLIFSPRHQNLAPILCGENKSTHVACDDAIVMKATAKGQRQQHWTNGNMRERGEG